MTLEQLEAAMTLLRDLRAPIGERLKDTTPRAFGDLAEDVDNMMALCRVQSVLEREWSALLQASLASASARAS